LRSRIVISLAIVSCGRADCLSENYPLAALG
jgi:hypothetical protein